MKSLAKKIESGELSVRFNIKDDLSRIRKITLKYLKGEILSKRDIQEYYQSRGMVYAGMNMTEKNLKDRKRANNIHRSAIRALWDLR